MQRNKTQTRAAILDAVGQLLARSGFKELGVNSIAREAGVDKVLIYRYFGGLPELLKAFAEETSFWPDLPELMSGIAQPPEQLTEVERARLLLLAFGRALRRRPLTQEIMRWELLEQNELTEALARHRERQSAKLFQGFGDLEGIDVPAIASLLAAGQTYLILRSKTVNIYNGIALRSEADWERIERAASALVDAAFAGIKPKKQPPAKRPGTRGKAAPPRR